MFKSLLLGCLLTVGAQFSIAQDSIAHEHSMISDLSVSAFPIAFYLPETGFSGGGAGIATFRINPDSSHTDRPSQFQFGTAVTSRKQVLIFLPYEIYLDHGKYRLEGELGYYRYSYNYFGLGSESLLDNGEDYGVKFPRFDFSFIRQLSSSFLIGLGYKFDNYKITRVEEEGVLEKEQAFGIAGGTISALQARLLYDSRNHLFVPEKGWFVELEWTRGLKSLGSDYSYNRKTINIRNYISLFDKIVLASNLYFSSADNGTPFFRYPYLASSKRSRGYADRRFIDKNVVNLQVDLRFPIFGRFGGVLFASTGRVAPKIPTFKEVDQKLAAGLGLRFILNKQELTRVRLDFGFTSEGSNFYITINEAF